ncbi:MAG: hypothetical protein IJ185_04515 [Prevotella sp.]|nr:hypothetical protein [Prevotella sp.]
MKKIFTLISMAFFAISVNAQTTAEIWDASSLKDETAMKNQETDPQHDWTVVKASEITKTVNTAKNVIIHDPNDVLPWPGKHEKKDENGNIVYEKDENGNPTTTPVYEPNVTDPTTVTNNGSDQLYNYMIKGNTASVEMTAIGTPNLGETNNWTFGLAVDPTAPNNNKSLNTEACDPKFIDYIKMKSGNCTEKYYDWYEKNEDGDPVHKVANDKWDPACGVKPAIGSWYEFKVKANGTLKIGFFVNKNIQNNKLYFAEIQEDQYHFTLLDPSKLTVWGWVNNNTYAEDNENCIRNTQPRADYCVVQATNLQNPFLGYVSFAAEAGKTYMFVSPETQLGCYGFQFTAGGETGINTINTVQNADAPLYNLAGQKVSDDYKGLIIQNGKKSIKK